MLPRRQVFSEAILERNLKVIERVQGQRPAVAALDADTRAINDTNSGIRLEIRTGEGRWEALESWPPSGFPKQMLVIGPGLGGILDAIEDAGAATRVLALEPNPGIATLMLARRDWTVWIESGRLRLLAGPEFRGAATLARAIDVAEPPLILVNPSLAAHRPRQAAAAEHVARRMVTAAEANAAARRQFAGRYLLQTLGNLPRVAREGNARALDNLFRKLPAIVVAAGPSLDGNLQEIAAQRDRAIIVAVDTALRPLLAAGIRPHLVVAVDPGELNARHLAGLEGLDDMFLVAEGSLHASAFDPFAGRSFFFAVSDHEPWPWLRTIGIECGRLLAWGSVLTSAFDLVRRMGCDPIVFAGADLAYSGGRPYCRGTIYEARWAATMAEEHLTLEQLFANILKHSKTMSASDVHGAPIVTSPPLMAFRDWLVDQIASTPDRTCVNATGAGILAGGRIEQRSLDEALGGREPFDARPSLRGAYVPRDCSARLNAALARLLEPRDSALLARWRHFTADTVDDATIEAVVGDVHARLG